MCIFTLCGRIDIPISNTKNKTDIIFKNVQHPLGFVLVFLCIYCSISVWFAFVVVAKFELAFCLSIYKRNSVYL